MDGFAFHPYGINSSSAVDLPPNDPDHLALVDQTKLVRLLGKAFDGTAQVGSGLPILYDEYGIESIVPQEKAVQYAGKEPATTRPVDELAQAAAYAQAIKLAYCQSNVAGILLFHARDETGLSGWQSGLYYPDGTPKSSLGVVRDTMDAIASGALGKCAVAIKPVVAFAPRTRRISLRCDRDCVYRARLVRLPGRIDHGVEERTLAPGQPAVVPARRPRRARALPALRHVRARHAARTRRRALQRRVSGALAARGADARRLRRQRRQRHGSGERGSSSARSTTPSAIPGRRSTSSRRPASAPSGSRASGSRG